MTKVDKETVKQIRATEVVTGKKKVPQVCQELGISRSAYYKILKEDSLQEKVEKVDKKIQFANQIIDENKILIERLTELDKVANNAKLNKDMRTYFSASGQIIECVKTSAILKGRGISIGKMEINTQVNIMEIKEDILTKWISCTIDLIPDDKREAWKAKLKETIN